MLSGIGRAFWIAPLLIAGLALVMPASRAEDNLSGLYAISGRGADGASYDGELAIESQGHAFDVDWQRSGRSRESGFGLTLNHVIGVAYWPDNQALDSGLGLVIYRIDGGSLDGIWLPEGVYNRAPGRETLYGSPDLTGRYQITLGRNPMGGHYGGYVELERTGDQFKVSWHLTSSEYFVGSGLKMGNVLAVAYGYRNAPAVAAYCSNGRQLEGSWWTGPGGASGEETLRPMGGGNPEIYGLPQPNVNDPCRTPVAAR